MQWYEILIIIACVLIVFGVAVGCAARKRKNKSKGGCGGCCGGCSHCSEYKKILEAEKNSNK